jgi:hypothetical protein
MPRALALIVLCCGLAACGSGGKAAPAAPDTSAEARAIDAWCAERRAEVAPAELAAIRGQEVRQRARMAKMLAKADKNSILDDVYALAGKSAQEMLAEEGLMLSLPLPTEVDELLRRLHALPADSAAHSWGETLAGYRAGLFRIDRELKGPASGRADVEGEFKSLVSTYGDPEAQTAQAAQAGIAACAPMALNPEVARMYAELALSRLPGAGDVESMVGALRKREPWLMVRALPAACALPAIGDPAAGEPLSTFTIGLWKSADGTVSVTASTDGDGGTLTPTASGASWKTFTVDHTDAGEWRRVEPCPQ